MANNEPAGGSRPRDRHVSIIRRSVVPHRRPPGEARPDSLDWPAWLGLIERQRKLLQRQQAMVNGGFLPQEYFIAATCCTFRLEDLDITDQEVIEALTHGPAQRRFRSRAAQRIRNHVAILHTIETALRLGQPLKTGAVVRWYTSISSGLSMASLSGERMTRLDQLARRINSPQLRLQPALTDIARTHAELLADPLFPSFNGILSRLLLRYHLGRSGLPFALFDADTVPKIETSEPRLLLRLLRGIDDAYEMLRRTTVTA